MKKRLHGVKYFGLLWIATIVGHFRRHVAPNWFYRACLGIELPHISIIHRGACFFGLRDIIIGKNLIAGDHAFLDGRSGIVIGNNVNIASEARIWTEEHDLASPTLPQWGPR